MIQKIKKALNWCAWNLGGLRDPECFFEGLGDEFDNHLEKFGIDQ